MQNQTNIPTLAPNVHQRSDGACYAWFRHADRIPDGIIRKHMRGCTPDGHILHRLRATKKQRRRLRALGYPSAKWISPAAL